MVKKQLSLLVAIIMIFANIHVIASANISEGTEPTISVKDVTVEAGATTAEVEVWIENNPGIAGVLFNIGYDEEMSLTGVEFNSAFGAYATAAEPYTNPQPISFMSPLAEVAVSGMFATLTFDLSNVSSSKKELPISVTCDRENTFNGDLEEVKFATKNGKIIVKSSEVEVTVDGIAVKTDGTIVLGVDNGGAYSLPENVLGYYIEKGEEQVFVDAGKYSVTGGESITTVDMNVKMLDGAQVRYGGGLDENGKVSDGNGLRFIATVDRSNIDEQAVLGYGMKVGAEGSDKVVVVDAVNWQDAETFTVAITNFDRNNYNRNYTAVPFVKVKYSDNTEKTIYGTEEITRSVYYVATGLLKGSNTENDYGVSTSYGLYDVLNAYVNMVGVRLSMDDNGNVTVREIGDGAYKGEAFFDVSSVKNEDGTYTITVTPISEDFEYPVKIMKYWDEYVRINNNNTKVRANIFEVTHTENGGVTFKLTRP